MAAHLGIRVPRKEVESYASEDGRRSLNRMNSCIDIRGLKINIWQVHVVCLAHMLYRG